VPAPFSSFLRCGLLLLLSTTLPGCAVHPYRPGIGLKTERDVALQPGETQVERGEPLLLVDKLGWLLGTPSRILFLDHRIDNHDVSAGTEQALTEYLAVNGLDRVKVRINQYDPGGDWSRLARNESVGGFWRYTLGAIWVLNDTLIPGRLIGGDSYNPFTNTIRLYSDNPAIALREGAHAKAIARTEWKGTATAAALLPIVPLFTEARAIGDVIGYVAEYRHDLEKEAYETLYPSYAIGAPGAASLGMPPVDSYLLQAACAVAGHIVGHVRSARIPDHRETARLEP
jgi:hypothetical protein